MKRELSLAIANFIKTCSTLDCDILEFDEFIDEMAKNHEEIALISEEIKQNFHNLINTIKQIQ